MEQGVQIIPPSQQCLLQSIMYMDRLIVKQTHANTNMWSRALAPFSYEVRNSSNAVLYHVNESSNGTTMFGGNLVNREILLHGFEGPNQVFMLHKPRIDCCTNSWDQFMDVHSPAGTLIGKIKKINVFASMGEFDVCDANGQVILHVKAPAWGGGFASNIDFKILTRNNDVQIGKITKVWEGFMKETRDDNDLYEINFPANLEINAKATLLATVFFIDFVIYAMRRRR